MTNPQFIECDACRAKSGSPVLCAGCQHNRRTIDVLERAVEQLAARMAMVDTPVEPKAERVCADSADGNHVLKQDGPFSIVYCDACGMNKGFREPVCTCNFANEPAASDHASYCPALNRSEKPA